ncbi:hypothetical protein FQN54_009959 [Arachnomyces sp. PD_36]|nr:hypothetical protein FQN54_009959 [Arachnomyces sp. PD_36]
MAQQGGTYRVPSKTDAAIRFDSSSQARGHEDDKKDGQPATVDKSRDKSHISEGTDVAIRPDSHDDSKTDGQWDVVTNPEAEGETNPPARRMSSHFDFKLGWGKWKHTLFSWDMNVRKPSRGGTDTQQ